MPIKAYVISLPERAANVRAIQQTLAKYGVQAQPFEAFDARKHDLLAQELGSMLPSQYF